eukprot:365631-Chlamydomonas_euryale.AAC.10
MAPPHPCHALQHPRAADTRFAHACPCVFARARVARLRSAGNRPGAAAAVVASMARGGCVLLAARPSSNRAIVLSLPRTTPKSCSWCRSTFPWVTGLDARGAPRRSTAGIAVRAARPGGSDPEPRANAQQYFGR